jgi:hypothetical protein
MRKVTPLNELFTAKEQAMYEDRYASGNRDEWEFEFSGKALAPTAQARCDYHTGREKFWNDKASTTEKAIRDKGVSLEERGVTGGVQFVAKVDQALGSQLGEERGKADKHRSVREQLEGFLHEFNRTPERLFKLKIADMKYFGLIGQETKFGDEVLT